MNGTNKPVSTRVAVVDAGNTSVHAGLWVSGRLHTVREIATRECLADSPTWRRWMNVFFDRTPAPTDVWVCSVVPQAVLTIRRACRGHGKTCVVVGRTVKVPIENRYRLRCQVGQDRLVGAFAALRMCRPPVIIVDVGTAVTLDVVGETGAYEGGVIVPGLAMAAEALHKRTALLPRVDVRRPRTLIGKTTQGSILSGLYYGYAALIKGLLQDLQGAFKTRARTVLTGGMSPYLLPLLEKSFDHHDRHLVLKGLGWMADRWQREH